MLFTPDRVARIVGMDEERLARWVRSDVYRPVRYPATFFDFRDLVALRVLAILRDRKVPTRELRSLGHWLRARHDRPWSELRFGTVGRSVYFDDPGTKRLVGHRPVGNLAMREVVDFDLQPLVIDVRNAASKVNERTARGQIDRVRGVQGGAAVVAGTRVPIRALQQLRRDGMSKRQILREFPALTAADLDAAVAA